MYTLLKTVYTEGYLVRRAVAAVTYLGFGLERLKAAHLGFISVGLLDIKFQSRKRMESVCASVSE